MIIDRVEHPRWLSNAYLLADRPGGRGVLVDSNGIFEPLLERIQDDKIEITHVLVTHHHDDHVVNIADLAKRLNVPLVGSELTRNAGVPIDETIGDGAVMQSGDLQIRAIATPGHCPDHTAFLVNGRDCLTADCLFKGTVGGTAGGGPTGFTDQTHSIMQRLLTLPRETRIHPGHREPSTVGDEWEHNSFVRVWRGVDPEGKEACRVNGEEATLILFGPDYDGTHKAWVRYSHGRDAIVGGSQVERNGASE
jgi:glyoxylase-like metal-dependent hydrolase (beta-lactamase superfamily II)